MNNPEKPPVYFSDEITSLFYEEELGDLTQKIQLACDDNAQALFGDTYFPHPSSVELTPYVNTTDGVKPEILVRAWHETGIPGKSAVFQPHDTVVSLDIIGENAFLSNKDTKTSYPVTPRETLVLNGIRTLALKTYVKQLPKN